MTADEINGLRSAVREKNPLIHCITNPISINQCANTILSVGARPIMAEHPDEVAEITQTASALMLNIANITDVRMQSIMLSAETAKKNNIPFVLDAVGIACSALRRRYVYKLAKKFTPVVIKGNYSEICALYDEDYKSSGVDSHSSADIFRTENAAVCAARKYSAVVLASGKTDIITDGRRLLYINNGTPSLGSITGTGCMLGALTAAYLSYTQGYEAAAAACVVLGICGELSEGAKGTGSFMVELLDNLSTLSSNVLEKRIRLEEGHIEKA